MRRADADVSRCAMRAAVDQIGLVPLQVRAERIPEGAWETADPVHLVRLFGIHPGIAVNVHAAHPDKGLPRSRCPGRHRPKGK